LSVWAARRSCPSGPPGLRPYETKDLLLGCWQSYSRECRPLYSFIFFVTIIGSD
jgi:hypothetical protein